MTKSRLVLTLMCIAVTGVLAGCGGHSGGSTTTTSAATTKPKHSGLAAAKIAYEFKMQKLGTSLGTVLAQVGEDDQRIVSNSTSEQTSAAGITVELRIAQKRLRLAAVQLAAIKPPADVKIYHEALLHGVIEYANELTGVMAIIKTGNFAELGQIGTLKGVVAMQNASQAITRKGYAII